MPIYHHSLPLLPVEISMPLKQHLTSFSLFLSSHPTLISVLSLPMGYNKTIQNYTSQVPVYVKPEDPPVVKHEIPPYNGWGSERDTLASCMSLNPVPVRRDLLKFMENQGKTLRYTAKFSNPKTTADSERRFVFTYYLEDSTLSIFEPPQRNSGVVGGKFLARGAYKRTVREKDSEELNPHVKRDKDPLVKLLKEKLQQYMSGSKYMLLNAFKHSGGIGGGDAITLTEFKHGCMMCGMPMKKAEARHLFNLYDVDNSGSISFKEFVEGVMENTYGKFGSAAGRSTARWIRPSDFFVGAKIKIQFPRNGAETAEYTILGADAYTLTLMEMRPQDFPKSNVEHIIRELATRLQQYNVNVRQVFKSYDTRGEGHISHEQFKALLGKWAKDFGFVDEELSQQDLITLTRHYDEDDDGYISIKEFCDALTSTPIILLNEIDEEHIEAAERKLYDELHPLPPGKLRETFNSMDKLGNGMITIGEFHEFLEAHEIKLNDIETAALFQHYDVRNEGVFDYNEFAALMEADHYISTKKKKKKREKKKEILRSSYVDILKRREHELSDDAKFYSMIKTFCRFFFPRRITLRKAFLSHDHKGTGVVNMVDFISSVRKTNADFPKASLDAMVSALFTDDAMSAVNFQDFMDIIWRQDVKTFKNLIARGTRLDKRETWGNVHSELQADE